MAMKESSHHQLKTVIHTICRNGKWREKPAIHNSFIINSLYLFACGGAVNKIQVLISNTFMYIFVMWLEINNRMRYTNTHKYILYLPNIKLYSRSWKYISPIVSDWPRGRKRKKESELCLTFWWNYVHIVTSYYWHQFDLMKINDEIVKFLTKVWETNFD